MKLARYLIKRLLLLPVSMFVVASLAFLLTTLIPGNPAVTISGGFASPGQIRKIDNQLGLNKPLGTRYLDYLDDLIHGNLGRSSFSHQTVLHSIITYLPNTIELIVAGLIVAVLLGMLLGGVGAYFQGLVPDRLTSIVVTATQSTPDFVLGLVGIFALFYLLRLVPAPVGSLSINESAPPTVTHFLLIDCVIAGKWSLLGSALAHMILPVLTLGIVYSSYFAKTARTSLGQAMNSPQVEFARACGLPERQVFRYALLAARTPILTYGAILFGALLGGDAIVETIFSWQGVGQWALQAMLEVDPPVIEGFIVITGLITLIIYIVLDVTVVLLDPRLNYG